MHGMLLLTLERSAATYGCRAIGIELARSVENVCHGTGLRTCIELARIRDARNRAPQSALNNWDVQLEVIYPYTFELRQPPLRRGLNSYAYP